MLSTTPSEARAGSSASAAPAQKSWRQLVRARSSSSSPRPDSTVRIAFEQAKGFALYAIRTVLSGRGDELLDLARTNWRQLF